MRPGLVLEEGSRRAPVPSHGRAELSIVTPPRGLSGTRDFFMALLIKWVFGRLSSLPLCS